MFLSLREKEGFLNATLKISEIWKIDKAREANSVYGTNDRKHPGVSYLYDVMGDYYISGDLTKIALPKHYSFFLKIFPCFNWIENHKKEINSKIHKNLVDKYDNKSSTNKFISIMEDLL